MIPLHCIVLFCFVLFCFVFKNSRTCSPDNGAPRGKHYIAYGVSFECFECFLTDFTPRLMVHAPVVPGNGACTSL